jgi:hypothetical protein
MFIGYPRSGHTLIGSVLDAHPDAVIAHEFDALIRLRREVNRNDLYRSLLENSQNFTRSGREWNGYTYLVSNQWHGLYRNLRVIGDKKGGASSRVLAHDPSLLTRLRQIVDADIKLVHVLRNPYDNVASMFRNGHTRSLRKTIDRYASLCEVNSRLRLNEQISIFDLRHEDFVENPERCLDELCQYLGLSREQDYLSDCASIVFRFPRQSRHDIEWDKRSIDKIRRVIARHDFLHGYSFRS